MYLIEVHPCINGLMIWVWKTSPKPTFTTPPPPKNTHTPTTPTKGNLLLLQQEWKEEKALLLQKIDDLEKKNVELAMKAAKMEGQVETFKAAEESRQKELDRVWGMVKHW